MSDECRSPSVLMFPVLAHGHIIPYLGLAKNLSDRGFLIHLCSTPIILVSVRKMIPEKYSGSIRPVELHLPDLPELPPHYHTTNGLPPHLNSTLRKALRMSKPNFFKIMETLKPDILIFDFQQVWAEGVARELHIPAVRFYNATAATCSLINFITRVNSQGGTGNNDYPFPALHPKGHGEAVLRSAVDHLMRIEREPEDHLSKPQMVLIRSSMAMEPEYIEYYSETIGCKVVPVGLLAQDQTDDFPENTEEILSWLGKKERGSVVYISFGSEFFLSKEDIEEMAHGLELVVHTNVSFIWVLRFPKGENLSAQDILPQDFLKRVGERGRIVEGWAPQLNILNHPSVGGFVTHCGWNSIMESLNFAVPIIAMPMHLDQPVNARFLVEKGLAVEIRRDSGWKLCREEIARAVGDAIGGENGDALMMRVKNMSKRLQMKQREEMDGAAQELRKLCGIYQEDFI